MIHSFDAEVATKYGLLEAILFYNISYWVQKNEANEKNFFDGDYWTYNSASAFSKLFPYASKRKIEIALKNLRDNGLIKTGNYNENKYDRTLWYSLGEVGRSISRTGDMDITSKLVRTPSNVTPIPDINPQCKPVTPYNPPEGEPQKQKKKRKSDSAEEVEAAVNGFGYPASTVERLREWLEVRKAKRVPNTVSAVSKCIKTLPGMAKKSGMEIDAYLDQVIMRGWAAFYEIKLYQQSPGGYGNAQRPQGPALKEAR